jgi:uncharacterized 2Fe-2S/4Fe-4S cluster protein (DUF4445 family)
MIRPRETREKIGLLPENAADKVVFCGNTSIDGSTILLTNRNQWAFIEEALNKMVYLQLAESPKFLDCFLRNLNFPQKRVSGSGNHQRINFSGPMVQ